MAEDPNTFVLLLRLVLSFGMVLALVGGATWMLRRRGLLRGVTGARPTGRLEVLDRKSLGKTSSIVLARVGGRPLLLGVTGQQIAVLSDAPDLDAAWRTQDGSATEAAVEPAAATTTVVPLRATGTGTAAATSISTATRNMTGGARRTGRTTAAPTADRTRMSFVEALQELTIRRS